MTSREHLKRLVALFCEARYGVPKTGPVVFEASEGDHFTYHDLEGVLADFEVWRAAYEVRAQERNSACLI